MLWWIPPVIATLAAIAWVSVRAQRAEHHPDDRRTDLELERMEKALAKPLPTQSADSGLAQ